MTIFKNKITMKIKISIHLKTYIKIPNKNNFIGKIKKYRIILVFVNHIKNLLLVNVSNKNQMNKNKNVLQVSLFHRLIHYLVLKQMKDNKSKINYNYSKEDKLK